MLSQGRESKYPRITIKKGPRVRAFIRTSRVRRLGAEEEGRRTSHLAFTSESRRKISTLEKRSVLLEMRPEGEKNDRSDTNNESLLPPVANLLLNIQYSRDLFTSPPPIIDDLQTETSRLQAKTIAECLPFLKGTKVVNSGDDEDGDDVSSSDVSSSTSDANAPNYAQRKRKVSRNKNGGLRSLPMLRRDAHIRFLRDKLGSYPWYFAAMDASRPWVFYWALNGLVLLGVDVGEYVDR